MNFKLWVINFKTIWLQLQKGIGSIINAIIGRGEEGVVREFVEFLIGEEDLISILQDL